MWAVASVRTVVPLFYAYNDTRTPVHVQRSQPGGLLHRVAAPDGPDAPRGIALAISLAAAVQLTALLLLLRRRVGRLGLTEVGGQHLAGRPRERCDGRGDVGRGAPRHAGTRGRQRPAQLAVFLAAAIVAAVVYLGSAWLMRAPELADITSALRRRRVPRA